MTQVAQVTANERFTLIAPCAIADTNAFASDVEAGLTDSPKHLPCRYFYDGQGSLLFEQICELPEYYVTRVERGLLEERADDIAARCARGTAMVELGSGSAAKTRILIEAFLRRNSVLRYIPVDGSHSMLRQSSIALLQQYPALEIFAVAGEYDSGLRELENRAVGPKLILWLGSSIGNFDPPEAATFLRRVRGTLAADDRMLLGIDLRKDRIVLERAYDDSQGVTAAFNLNLLGRINRELGGHFDVENFRHRAVYDEQKGRIEMYLVSNHAQRVPIDRLGLTISFADQEAVHTENSYKYSMSGIEVLADTAGFSIETQWMDNERRFSVSLFAPKEK